MRKWIYFFNVTIYFHFYYHCNSNLTNMNYPFDRSLSYLPSLLPLLDVEQYFPSFVITVSDYNTIFNWWNGATAICQSEIHWNQCISFDKITIAMSNTVSVICFSRIWSTSEKSGNNELNLYLQIFCECNVLFLTTGICLYLDTFYRVFVSL